MTDPNAPRHLLPGETVSSSSNSVTLGASKALVGGAAGTAIAFLTALKLSLNDGTITGQEWVDITIATIVAAVAAFGLTYATPTKVTLN